jgi:hypothetical protein
MPASKFLTASLGASALAFAAFVAPSTASAAPAAAGLSSLVAPDAQLVQQVQWRGRGGYYGRRYYGGPRYYGYRRGNGAAVAAGVIGGLALGAAIAGAASAPPPVAYAPAPVYGGGDWIAYCSSKYRSFNPATGLYLGYDGQYHPCQ